MRRSATASSFLNTGTTSINFPVWQHRWWSNVCKFWPQGYLWKHHGSLLWIAPILDDEVPCSWRRLKLIGMNTEHPLFWILRIRHVWFKQVLCNDLSFDLVQCGGIVFFLSPSLLRQLPENDSVFQDISGRLFLKIHEDGFAVTLQLVFLPFLTKFLMKGLVRWVLPFFHFYSMKFFRLQIHGGRCIWPWSFECA